MPMPKAMMAKMMAKKKGAAKGKDIKGKPYGFPMKKKKKG